MLSVDGVLGHEARMFLNCLGDNIADMWRKSRSEVMGWVRAKMSFAILRATNLCLRGSRTKWRREPSSIINVHINDGAGLPGYKLFNLFMFFFTFVIYSCMYYCTFWDLST